MLPNHANLYFEVTSTLSLLSSLRKLPNVTLGNNFFPTSDMHDGVIYYEDQTALSCFYCQANFNNCFLVPRREEKSE